MVTIISIFNGNAGILAGCCTFPDMENIIVSLEVRFIVILLDPFMLHCWLFTDENREKSIHHTFYTNFFDVFFLNFDSESGPDDCSSDFGLILTLKIVIVRAGWTQSTIPNCDANGTCAQHQSSTHRQQHEPRHFQSEDCLGFQIWNGIAMDSIHESRENEEEKERERKTKLSQKPYCGYFEALNLLGQSECGNSSVSSPQWSIPSHTKSDDMQNSVDLHLNCLHGWSGIKVRSFSNSF